MASLFLVLNNSLRNLLLASVSSPEIPRNSRNDSNTHHRTNDNTCDIPSRQRMTMPLILVIVVLMILIPILIIIVRVTMLLLLLMIVIFHGRSIKARNLKRKRLRLHERNIRTRIERLIHGQVSSPQPAVVVVWIDVLGRVPELDGRVGACLAVQVETGDVEAYVAKVEGWDAVGGEDDLEVGVVGGVY